MENITLSIIGQRVLFDVLKERKDILKMEVFFFENLDQYFNQLKKNIKKDILVVDFSNFEIIEKSDYKITNPIIYLTENSNKFNVKTKFQKYDLISCPLNIIDFINKVNLVFSKFQFAEKSKIDLLNYTINLNSREISNNNNGYGNYLFQPVVQPVAGYQPSYPIQNYQYSNMYSQQNHINA